jgi:hypothetical protein
MPDEESMIQDLRELEEELRNNGEYRKANIIDLFIRHSTHCKIDKSVINDKLKNLNNKIHLLSSTSSESEKMTEFKREGAAEILEEILK